MINILAININSPAKDRARRQLQELLRSKSDILILTEVKKTTGADELIQGLQGDGYQIAGWSEGDFEGFTTIVASRVPYKISNSTPCRNQQLTLNSNPRLTIMAAYGVSSDPFGRNSEEKVRSKRDWIKLLVEQARLGAQKAGNLIVIGDLNFVDDRSRPQYHSLYDFERDAYKALTDIPMKDILYDKDEYSWVTHQGLGFRYDHAFVSPSLTPNIESCEYVHEWRVGEERLSDHSAVRIGVSATYEPLADLDASVSYQKTLF